MECGGGGFERLDAADEGGVGGALYGCGVLFEGACGAYVDGSGGEWGGRGIESSYSLARGGGVGWVVGK